MVQVIAKPVLKGRWITVREQLVFYSSFTILCIGGRLMCLSADIRREGQLLRGTSDFLLPQLAGGHIFISAMHCGSDGEYSVFDLLSLLCMYSLNLVLSQRSD